MNQTNTIWITEGVAWRREGMRHAQVLEILKVPKVVQAALANKNQKRAKSKFQVLTL